MVSAVKFFNEDRIERNEALKLQRIILEVLNIPIDDNRSDESLAKIFESRVKRIQVKDTTLYVGYEKDDQTVIGYAFPIGGPGFWGPISGMVAVNPEASKILGLAFHKHSETPGLGGRLKERWFTKQFAGIRLYPIEGEKKIFYLKPQGPKKAPNELDAITGATGTSRGIEAFLNRDLDHFMKQVWRNIRKG
jgi:Na+-transporting NADH:ubiquinone oxidoreductase subunit C